MLALRVIGALLVVMLLTVFQSVSYYQLANILPVWIQEHVALGIGTWSIPIPWFQSIDPLASVVAVAVFDHAEQISNPHARMR